MPVTPFHFGVGATLHAVAPRHVSFLSFCIANVLIDLESLYNLVYGRFPVHAFLHTYAGATLIIPATLALFLAARWFARKFWLPDTLSWQSLTAGPVTLGAVLGAYSHIVLDSVMHGDMEPMSPFSPANPLLEVISIEALHIACAVLAVIGVLVVGLRQRQVKEEKPL